MSIIKRIKLFFLKLFRINLLDTKSIVNYMFSAESLPSPLETEEENLLVKDFQENKNLKSKSLLIEHNLRLVMYIAKKFETNKIDMQDLVSVGSIGLIKAVDSYKLDKNIKLATYASRCIDNEILMFLRKNKRRKGEISFEDSLSYDSEGNELHLEDILGTDEDIVTRPLEEEIEKKILYEELVKLNDRDKEIMLLRYGLCGRKEKTQKEVAEMLGISQSYISRIEKKVINKLKIQNR